MGKKAGLLRTMMSKQSNGATDDGSLTVALSELRGSSSRRNSRRLSDNASQVSANVFPVFTPMLVMPFEHFQTQGRIVKSTAEWRLSAVEKGSLVEYSPDLFCIFVSHRWNVMPFELCTTTENSGWATRCSAVDIPVSWQVASPAWQARGRERLGRARHS